MIDDDLFQNQRTPPERKTKKIDYSDKELRERRVRRLEQQFEFTFPIWLFNFAVGVSQPVKVYAWFVQSSRYKVYFDENTRVMNFIGFGHKINYPKFAIDNIKRILGRELFDHFGRIQFAIDGDIQK